MLRKIHFALHYLVKPRWDTGISPPELVDFIHDHLVGKALDLGCGTGTNAITLARHGWQVTGVDFVGAAIRKARRKAQQAGVQVEFIIDDVTKLDHLNNLYDLILDIGCLHTLSPEQRDKYIKKILRLLASQGTYLLYAFIRSSSESDFSGLTDTDLHNLDSALQFIWRKDGIDHNQRLSAWFAYTKCKDV